MSAPLDRPPSRLALVSWSSGKDCAYALSVARASEDLEIVGLLTTMNETVERVSMHGVRRELVRRQAASLGLPLHTVELPDPCSNEIYEQRMGAFVEAAKADGVEVVVFGDLFLEEIRAYRERQLEGTGITPVFPLFGRETRPLAEEMLAAGIVATLTCVDGSRLPRDLVGRRWDARLLTELPEAIDPCGERGEFHSFVSDGPGFTEPVAVRVGETVIREPFVFADLLPT